MAGEACDGDGMGNGAPTASCDPDCTSPQCGDGVVNPVIEQCDQGTTPGANSPTSGCPGCQIAVCGDGHHYVGTEQCDPGSDAMGNPVNTSACDSDCTLPLCGDGFKNEAAGEECEVNFACQNLTCDPTTCLCV